MKIIHTADWHLGNRLMDRSRAKEQGEFLRWLLELTDQEKPDALIISGDVFDTGTPGEGTREMYYKFLSQADERGCHQVVVTAGNHDSVAQMESARPFLGRFHCQMVTKITAEEEEKALIEVQGDAGEVKGLICAIPYLRPADASVSTEERDEEGNSLSYRLGINRMVVRIGQLAACWKEAHPGKPVVAMGHLPVLGVERTNSTRDQLGTIEVVSESIFPHTFDYVALGHIHKASDPGKGRILYSGSPLAMGVDEAQYKHYVFVVDVGEKLDVRAVEVPKFTDFVQKKCMNRAELDEMLDEILRRTGEQTAPIWLSVQYYGGDLTPNELNAIVRQRLPEESVPCILTKRALEEAIPATQAGGTGDSLSNYTPETLFERRMGEYIAEHPGMEGRREKLKSMFMEALSEAIS